VESWLDMPSAVRTTTVNEKHIVLRWSDHTCALSQNCYSKQYLSVLHALPDFQPTSYSDQITYKTHTVSNYNYIY